MTGTAAAVLVFQKMMMIVFFFLNFVIFVGMPELLMALQKFKWIVFLVGILMMNKSFI